MGHPLVVLHGLSQPVLRSQEGLGQLGGRPAAKLPHGARGRIGHLQLFYRMVELALVMTDIEHAIVDLAFLIHELRAWARGFVEVLLVKHAG